jgi:hypothetical protein
LILGTLGDEESQLTCSMYIAKKMNSCELKGYSSFEKAVESLKNNVIQKVLVPGAYPSINQFIMDDNLEVHQSFVAKIPSLVFASSSANKKEISELFLHEATKNLVSDIPNISDVVMLTYVDSNEEACKQLVKGSNSTACITNSLCADYFDLKVHLILREGISMPWVIFKMKEKHNEENSNNN